MKNSMSPRNRVVAMLLFGALTSATAGCTLPRYKTVQVDYSLPIPATVTHREVIVLLEPMISGKSLDETLCDNITGLMWNPKESQTIGFTQNYAETISGNVSPPKLLSSQPASDAAKTAAPPQGSGFNISSRIMIPYGRYITLNFSELFSKTFPGSAICLDEQCVQGQLSLKPVGESRLIRVRFTRFSVSESKTNALTLIVEGNATSIIGGQSKTIVIRQQIVDRSITSEGFFHSDFLRAMNKMANEISSSVVQKVYELAAQEN